MTKLVHALTLDDDDREHYAWIVRELLNGLRITCDGDTTIRIVDALDEIVDELLGRIPSPELLRELLLDELLGELRR